MLFSPILEPVTPVDCYWKSCSSSTNGLSSTSFNPIFPLKEWGTLKICYAFIKLNNQASGPWLCCHFTSSLSRLYAPLYKWVSFRSGFFTIRINRTTPLISRCCIETLRNDVIPLHYWKCCHSARFSRHSSVFLPSHTLLKITVFVTIARFLNADCVLIFLSIQRAWMANH